MVADLNNDANKWPLGPPLQSGEIRFMGSARARGAAMVWMVLAVVYAGQTRVLGIHKTQNGVEMLMHSNTWLLT